MCNHSRLGLAVSTAKTSCLDANAFQSMKIISITAATEMNEPKDKIFHVVCASGYSD